MLLEHRPVQVDIDASLLTHTRPSIRPAHTIQWVFWQFMGRGTWYDAGGWKVDRGGEIFLWNKITCVFLLSLNMNVGGSCSWRLRASAHGSSMRTKICSYRRELQSVKTRLCKQSESKRAVKEVYSKLINLPARCDKLWNRCKELEKENAQLCITVRTKERSPCKSIQNNLPDR